ncbi:hypothetical protein HPB51_001691 [Rhipicephalus microplus]|uniref:Ig-like domain-containing protein n=1 Tax=Rhipicephalus microplus TaxID=6941 RepID=A0A9J6EWB4_RHIMP|nr:hypothetical protein HPB51_001691 [Rhipicephalus microplus]
MNYMVVFRAGCLLPPVPRARILEAPELFINSGSSINVSCAIEHSPEPPVFVFWYHNDRVINYDETKGGPGHISGAKRPPDAYVSSLFIRNARPQDSGNYTCGPSNADSTSVVVHVLNGRIRALVLKCRLPSVSVVAQLRRDVAWREKSRHAARLLAIAGPASSLGGVEAGALFPVHDARRRLQAHLFLTVLRDQTRHVSTKLRHCPSKLTDPQERARPMPQKLLLPEEEKLLGEERKDLSSHSPQYRPQGTPAAIGSYGLTSVSPKAEQPRNY